MNMNKWNAEIISSCMAIFIILVVWIAFTADPKGDIFQIKIEAVSYGEWHQLSVFHRVDSTEQWEERCVEWWPKSDTARTILTVYAEGIEHDK